METPLLRIFFGGGLDKWKKGDKRCEDEIVCM